MPETAFDIGTKVELLHLHAQNIVVLANFAK